MALNYFDLQRFAEERESMPSSMRLRATQEYLNAIADPDDRTEAEANLLFFRKQAIDTPEVVVVLLHGILSAGEWQHRAADLFREKFGMHAYPVAYGILDPIRFWAPWLGRRGAIAVVSDKLESVRRLHPGARLIVVAHSFGTYVISRLLLSDERVHLDRLLLCGSVIPLKYKWRDAAQRVSSRSIVNDVGTKDYWPAIASCVAIGYGSSGVLGFGDPHVRDRFHCCGHGGFFDDEHVADFWVPFVVHGRIVPSPFTSERPPVNVPLRVLSWLPTAWPLTLAAGIGALYGLFSLGKALV